MVQDNQGNGPLAREVDADRTNLAFDPSRFFGREKELITFEDYLSSGQHLVQIVGPAGAGKSRLAARTAERSSRDRSSRFPGGFWVIDLQEASDLDDAVEAFAQVLDIQLTNAGSMEAALRQVGLALTGRRPSFILVDHPEAVASSFASTLADWVERTERTFWIISSRQAIDLPRSVRLNLGPLPTPHVGLTESEQLRRNAAVELLLDRVKARCPTYEPDGTDLQKLAQVVRQLNGLPLALELVAGHMAAYTPGKLIDQLNEYYERLAAMNIGLTAGQLTLKATLDFSWGLLRPWERTALSQLTVFRGGFDLAAAQGVLDLRAAQGAPAISEVLQSLRHKYLLDSTGTGANGQVRLGLHPSVSEYAADQLAEKTDWREIVQRHAAHFAECAGRWVDRAVVKGQTTELKRLAMERDNLEAVLDRALTPSLYNKASLGARTGYDSLEAPYSPEIRKRPLTLPTDWVLATLLALQPTFHPHSSLALYLVRINRVLGVIELSKPSTPLLRGQVLVAKGRVLRLLNQISQSLNVLREALDIAQTIQELKLFALAHLEMGELYTRARQWENAFASCHSALDAATGAGEPVLSACATGLRGTVHHRREQYPKARRYYQQAIRLLDRWGARRDMGRFLINLGRVHAAFNQLDQAEKHHLLALDICGELADRGMEAVVLVSLGETYADFGQLDRAHSVFQVALALAQEIGSFHSAARIHTFLGQIELHLGKVDQALEHAEKSRSIQQEMGADPISRARSVALLGLIDWVLERPESALEAVNQAATLARDARSPSFEALFLGIRGALEAELHRTSDAQSTFQAADFILENTPYTWVSQAVSIYQGFLDLTLASLAESQRDGPAALRHRNRALNRLVQIIHRRSGEGVTRSIKPDRTLLNLDVTCAAERLEKALPVQQRLQLRVEALDPTGKALVVDAGGTWFRPPSSNWVEIGERSKLRPVLEALVKQRESGGGPLSLAQLVQQAWPENHLDPSSSMDRIRWAIDTLQQFGLKDALLSAQGLYTLDPKLTLILVTDEVLLWSYPFTPPSS